jgi:hypothetical protein
MLRATIWHDLRWRLLGALLLVASPAALVAWSYVLQPPRSAAGASALSYLEYLDAAWFQLPGPSAAFLVAAVLVGAGGVLLRPRTDLTYLLALPVSRRRWLLAHVGMSLAALAALVLVVGLVLAAGAWRAGVPLASGPLLARSLAVLGAAGAWVGVTVGVLALVRSPVLAMVLVLGTVAALPTTRFRLDLPVRQPPPPMLPPWDPWALADPRAWHDGLPFASLLVAAAFGIAGTMLALYLVERFEP